MRYLVQVFLGIDRGPVSWLIRALLWPLSLIYRVGLAAYLLLYNLGVRKRCKLGVPVISIGNLTCGGTGKTPAVQAVCRMLCERGCEVVILSRGHGGSARGATVVSDGERILAASDEVGDEPILLAATLPGVPVVTGRDRRESGKLAVQRFQPDVIVLDDGLQYWQLHRDLDIVVLSARRPFGSGFVLPMGDLREPISGLRRAGLVLLTGAASIPEDRLASVRAAVSRLAPGVPVFAANHEPVSIRNVETGVEQDVTWMADRKVFAFCGIGQPESFLNSLHSLRPSLVGNTTFPDHYRLSDADITAIIDGANVCGAEAIVTTEKDCARLGGRHIPHLYTLVIELKIEDNLRFAQYIANRINP